MGVVNRRAVREAAMRTVFECDFRSCAAERDEAFERNISELAIKKYEADFAAALLRTTFDKIVELREWVERLAPDWPFTKIAPLDRAVLLVGLTELKFLASEFDIPPKVTLNEFVEIAKNYGGDSSRRFINGVLASAKNELELQKNVS